MDSLVSKLRPSDGYLLGTFSVGVKPFGALYDGANVWIANTLSDDVSKLRPSDGAVLGTFPAGVAPNGLAFDGSNVWVTNLGFTGSVTRLRGSDGTNLEASKSGRIQKASHSTVQTCGWRTAGVTM